MTPSAPLQRQDPPVSVPHGSPGVPEPSRALHFIRYRFKRIGGKAMCLSCCRKVSLPFFLVRTFLGFCNPYGLPDEKEPLFCLAKKGIVKVAAYFKSRFQDLFLMMRNAERDFTDKRGSALPLARRAFGFRCTA